MTEELRLPVQQFAKLLIASLVLRGTTAFRPHEATDQHAAMELYSYLSHLVDIERAKTSQTSPLLKDLIRIRNAISPSHTGAFDRLEALLRDQQHWLTSSRNPTYEAISFDVGHEVAEQILADVNRDVVDLVRRASDAYSDGARPA